MSSRELIGGVFRTPALIGIFFCILTSPALADPSSIGLAVGTSLRSAIDEAFVEPTQQSLKSPLELELGSLELTSLDGKAIAADGYKEKKILLYFWSIYCRGCLDTLKDIENLKSELDGANIQLLTVHLFEPDRERLINVITNLGLKVPIMMAPKAVRDLFSIRILPASLVFDQNHRLLARFDGMLDSKGLRLTLLGKKAE